MQFKIQLLLNPGSGNTIPVNYQYPLSAAIYRIITKGDAEYADFLHQKGYGKGFKLFTFSQLQVPFKIIGDRLKLLGNEAQFQINFHLPQAMESFVKGLFQSEKIDIADKQSKASFTVLSVESLPPLLSEYKPTEIIQIQARPLSPIVAGIPDDQGKYVFLSPDNKDFSDSLIYNWRNKIATCFNENTTSTAILLMDVIPMKHPFKSRLITIKADSREETKIRGWMNFELKITGEKRFVELLLNAGAGVYNSMGSGYMAVIRV